MSDAALIREALRVYRRYQLEVVEALNLCPWAVKARLDGAVTERVLLQRDQSHEPAMQVIRELEACPEIEIILVIFPRINLSLGAFEQFVAELREADTSQWPLGGVPFAAAAFHPEARRVGEAPERLVQYIRRTPDPTIQLVRRSVLDKLRRGTGEGKQFIDINSLSIADLPKPQRPLREVVATANAETLIAHGFSRFDALIEDIRSDRERSYAALGEAVAAQESASP